MDLIVDEVTTTMKNCDPSLQANTRDVGELRNLVASDRESDRWGFYDRQWMAASMLSSWRAVIPWTFQTR